MSEEYTWIDKFLNKFGYDYLCKVDDDYIKDKFNLTGLEREFPNFKSVYDSLFQKSIPSNELYESAIHLYGLIHSRYILTVQGLLKMNEKYLLGHYGTCPRILCKQSKLLPLGLSDRFGIYGVKLYCPVCEDIYSPKSTKHNSLDGAYFGSTFPHLFLLTFSQEVYQFSFHTSKLFGFKIHN